jgi:hypothetical protein
LVVDSRQGAANLVEGYFFDPHGGSLFCFLLNHTRNDFALAIKMSGNFEIGRTGACDRPFAVVSGDGGRSAGSGIIGKVAILPTYQLS